MWNKLSREPTMVLIVLFFIIIAFVGSLASPSAASITARKDPPDTNSTFELPHWGTWICYAKGNGCDFVSWPLRVTVPGEDGPVVLSHVDITAHWTLLLRKNKRFNQFIRIFSTRQMYYVYAFGSFRNASTGKLGSLLGSCDDMGHANYTRRFTSKECNKDDTRHTYHSGELFIRFTLSNVPGYFWVCHVWSPVARWYGSRIVGRRGYYKFSYAKNIAGWDHGGRDRLDEFKSRVGCDRHPNVGNSA